MTSESDPIPYGAPRNLMHMVANDESADGLLISADLGVGMERVAAVQSSVRNLIVATVVFACHEEGPKYTVWEEYRNDRVAQWIRPSESTAREALTISSSVSANPWTEVISYVAVGGIGAAISKGLGYVPAMLDLGLRIATLRPEHRIRKKELRNRERELDDEFLDQLLTKTTPSAKNLLAALREMGPEARSVSARLITAEEVDQRRSDVLRLMRREE